MRGGETADRDNGNKVVEANDRMAEAGKNALAEGRWRVPAYEMMGESRSGIQSQYRQTQAKAYQLPIYKRFSRRQA